jgi:hypothetical protein
MLSQYLHLRALVIGVELDVLSPDHLFWIWCASGAYSSTSVYNALFLGQSALVGTKEL